MFDNEVPQEDWTLEKLEQFCIHGIKRTGYQIWLMGRACKIVRDKKKPQGGFMAWVGATFGSRQAYHTVNRWIHVAEAVSEEEAKTAKPVQLYLQAGAVKQQRQPVKKHHGHGLPSPSSNGRQEQGLAPGDGLGAALVDEDGLPDTIPIGPLGEGPRLADMIGKALPLHLAKLAEVVNWIRDQPAKDRAKEWRGVGVAEVRELLKGAQAACEWLATALPKGKRKAN